MHICQENEILYKGERKIRLPKTQIGTMLLRKYIPPLKYAAGTTEIYGSKQIIPTAVES
jgi:hypothetical protein